MVHIHQQEYWKFIRSKVNTDEYKEKYLCKKFFSNAYFGLKRLIETGSPRSSFNALSDPYRSKDRTTINAADNEYYDCRLPLLIQLTWDISKKGYPSENMVLYPWAYLGSTYLVCDAAENVSQKSLVSFQI